ncbi:MAG: NAD(P)H-dependent oxidoreductase [Pyrinomonadaceae bacterium]
MSERKLFIPLLLGTPRQNRESENVAKWVHARMGERPDIETQLFDVRDFYLPFDDYGPDIKDQFPEWRDAIVRADGLVVVTPEYNHGYPGALKGVLDLLLREYVHKAVAFVGVSAGPWGGTRVIESMVTMVRELGLAATFTDLNFPGVASKFDDGGNLVDDAYLKRVSGFLDELVWMATTLRWGRQNVPSKFHQ